MIDIFVPVYNEGNNIENLLNELFKKVKSEFEVLIVYDDESDDTLPVLKKIKANYTFTVRVEKNLYGKGAANAFKTGMEKSRNQCLVFTMGDLSDSLETIDDMYCKIQEGYDMVVGSRYMKGGKKIGGGFLKTLFSRSASLAMHFLIGIPTYDVCNGFKMYRKEVVGKIPLHASSGFEVGLELALKIYLQGYKVTEVPAVWKDREIGKSNFKMWRWIPNYIYWCFYALYIKWF